MINYNIIPLGELLNKEYDETKLKKAFEKFSCQRELDLENFLRYKAITYDKTNYGKTYLIIDSDKLRDESEFCVVAYFTIAQKSLDVSAISKKKSIRRISRTGWVGISSNLSDWAIGTMR